MQPKELSLVHLVRPSKEINAKTPLLIMLHGYGSNEEDLFSFAAELPENIFIISPEGTVSAQLRLAHAPGLLALPSDFWYIQLKMHHWVERGDKAHGPSWALTAPSAAQEKL